MTIGLDGLGEGFDDVDSIYGRGFSNSKEGEMRQQIQQIVERALEPRGSVEARFEKNWGGKDSGYKAGVGVKYGDNRGSIKVEAEQESNGKGNVKVSGEYNRDNKEDRDR